MHYNRKTYIKQIPTLQQKNIHTWITTEKHT